MDLVLDAIESCQQHGGERKIGIRGGVGKAYLDAPTLGIGDPRNTDRRGPVARRIRKLYRSFEARHEALVAVRAGIGERIDGSGMFNDAANIVERDVRQATVLVACKQGFAFLLQ